MENNANVLPEQASFLDELPGIKKQLIEGKQETTVDMRVLPAYCQFELIKTVLETLERMQSEEEKQQKLIEALRTYITITEKPLDVQAAKDMGAKIGLYLGIVVWLCGMFFVCGYSPFVTNVLNFCKETAVYAIFALPLTIGIAVIAVLSLCIPVAVLALLGSAIGWGIATGINKIHTHRHTVKSENRLKSLMDEINLLLGQDTQDATQAPSSATNDTKYKEAGCSQPGLFLPVKADIKENEAAPTLGDESHRCAYPL